MNNKVCNKIQKISRIAYILPGFLCLKCFKNRIYVSQEVEWEEDYKCSLYISTNIAPLRTFPTKVDSSYVQEGNFGSTIFQLEGSFVWFRHYVTIHIHTEYVKMANLKIISQKQVSRFLPSWNLLKFCVHAQLCNLCFSFYDHAPQKSCFWLFFS